MKSKIDYVSEDKKAIRLKIIKDNIVGSALGMLMGGTIGLFTAFKSGLIHDSFFMVASVICICYSWTMAKELSRYIQERKKLEE